MKNCTILFILILLCACKNTSSLKPGLTLDERIELLKSPRDNYIMVASHRGDWRNYPENSIPAIESAIAMGVDIVEVDVQKTKDNVFILMHDMTLDRTTNATGKISNYTYQELKKYILRHGHGGYSEEHIPTLKEALLTVKGKVLIDLDKAYKYMDEIIPILKETGTLNQAIFVGPASITDLKYSLFENKDKINYMPIMSEQVKNYKHKIKTFESLELNTKVYEIILTDNCHLCYDLVKQIRKNNDHVWINSIYSYLSDGHWDDRALKDPEANWGFLIEKGATILQTDRPKLLLKYLQSKNIHN